jgi:hypothetical protein
VSAISRRLSRGRSTPMRRAIRRYYLSCVDPSLFSGEWIAKVSGVTRPRFAKVCIRSTPSGPRPSSEGGTGIAPGLAVTLSGDVWRTGWFPRRSGSCWSYGLRDGCLALTLLVARVGAADDPHGAVTANYLAVLTDPLDARLNLHRASFWLIARARWRRAWTGWTSLEQQRRTATYAGRRCDPG